MLCRRAIEPRSGLWTLPAGFMENGETAEAGALRETWEEARAKPTLGHLHTIYSIPHINQVYMLYHAVLETAEFAPGPESLDVELFALDAIPWKELAFHSVDFALEALRRIANRPARLERGFNLPSSSSPLTRIQKEYSKKSPYLESRPSLHSFDLRLRTGRRRLLLSRRL